MVSVAEQNLTGMVVRFPEQFLFLFLGLLVFVVAVLVMLARASLSRERQKQAQLQAELRQGHERDVARLQWELEHSEQALETQSNIVARQNEDLRRLEGVVADQRARMEEQKTAMASELELLRDARQFLTKEFEHLAGKVFDSKQHQFSQLTSQQLDGILMPFKQQISDFRLRVDEVHKNDVAQTHQLLGQINELQKQSQKIGDDALLLARALKGDNKVQGNWGEVVLKRLLESTGLTEGREFFLQVSGKDDSGRRQQPDVVVQLPNEKVVIVDSKVSLRAYEQYANAAEDADEQKRCLKEHIDSVRQHIKLLSAKKYDQLPGLHSLNFVLLFVPIESAFVCAVQNAPELVREAYDKNVVLTGPSSLMVVLRTIESLWQRERQDRNVEQIVMAAGKMYDQFVRFVESMNDVGNNLSRAQQAFQVALNRLSEGKGNLMKRAEDIKNLGARSSKSLPSTQHIEVE